jgi:hypothetical protein
MRRVITLLVLVLAAALPADALAIPMSARAVCGSSCGSFETQNGNNSLRSSGKGIVYGTVDRGRVWLLDRQADGIRGWSIYGYERGPIRHRGGWREFRGANMTFSAHDRWGVRIVDGRGVDVRIVAAGSVTIRGWGRYSLNGSGWRSWPSFDRLFAL